MGCQVGTARFGFGVLGSFILSVQRLKLTLSGIQTVFPDGILSGVSIGTGKQCRTTVDEGIRLFFGGFPACVDDLFQCGGTGLRFG